jgi:hypothetical protein
MLISSVVIALAMLLFLGAYTHAARGIVVYKKSGCDYYIVNTQLGYALLEWYGGNDPDEGDIIVGESRATE